MAGKSHWKDWRSAQPYSTVKIGRHGFGSEKKAEEITKEVAKAQSLNVEPSLMLHSVAELF